MKYTPCLAGVALLLGVAGCATSSRVVLQEPVGPCHRIARQGAPDGSLQVYTARQTAVRDINAETFFWNQDFGKNEFLRAPGRTGYTVYAPDGEVVRKVSNAQSGSEAEPARITLPPGAYNVEAEAELSSTANETVVIPVVIEAGQTTSVDLDPPAPHQAAPADPTQVVQLSDGRIIGCRAQHLVGLHTP